ncbi:MAG: 3-dehydroquinate synthase, partial [Lentisphaeria bacterium]
SIFFVPGGEQVKQRLEVIEWMVQALLDSKVCRHSYVMIIGGGAVLDAVSFAASITHRGIRQVRIPTTVLSQDDSAMGVKNGINYMGLKNIIGTFLPPHAVVCDSSFLKTLSDIEWVSGVSEAFKVGIIKDAELVEYLCKNAKEILQRNMNVMEHLIKKSAQLHFDHIALNNDPFEKGTSRPLDFGHWSAHKLESMTGGLLGHGSAVAIGICLDLCCALELGFISRQEVQRVILAIKQAGLPVWHEMLNLEENGELVIYQGLEQFREHIGGELTLSLPRGIGSMVEINDLPETIIRKSLAVLESIGN